MPSLITYLKKRHCGEVKDGGEDRLHCADQQSSMHDELGKIRRSAETKELEDDGYHLLLLNDQP